MSTSNRKRVTSQPFIGAAVQDPWALFAFGKAPHPAVLARKRTTPTPAKNKDYVGPGLQFATGLTLGAEALALGANRMWQLAIGVGQRNIGIAGAVYHGRKAYKEGDTWSAVKATAYGTFAAHGVGRMVRPDSPFTPGIGAVAGLMKAFGASNLAAFASFTLDSVANFVEMGHSLHTKVGHHAPPGGWQKAVSTIASRVPEKRLRAIQAFGATVMGGDAAYNMFQAYTDRRNKK